MPRRRSGPRQRALFAQPLEAKVVIEKDHPLVVLCDAIDWAELEERVEAMRLTRVKNAAGRPPHLRALIGAVLFRALRRLSYRETEEQIRYYLPARYLCALIESDWTPDANTLHDFEQSLGEQGMRWLNERVVASSIARGFGSAKVAVADTTVQEAAIPYPNEMGLMAAFVTTALAAGRRVGRTLQRWGAKAGELWHKAKTLVRDYRLFAKTREAKVNLMAKMAEVVDKVQQKLGQALDAARPRLAGYRKVAWAKLQKLRSTMATLLPQIRYWLRTRRVALGKIISLQMPELYAVVRGKIGKRVEFGLRWGVERLGGGFLLGRVAMDRHEREDVDWAVEAVEDHIALFGQAPERCGYDRGGHSAANVQKLKALGVRQVGLAPRGKSAWSVTGPMRERLVKERALIEGSIGAVKSSRYAFHRPNAHSQMMMAVSGQRSFLGFNLNKLGRELMKQRHLALAG